MKIPSFVWIIGLVILGGGALVLLSNMKNNSINESASLPVKVEVFADYNCSHCADFMPYVEKAKEKFGDKLDLQEKHLPFLASSSADYAYAAEAARLQGKFPEFNHDMFAWVSYKRDSSNVIYTYSEDDKTFYSQDINVTKLAERLGLNVDQFELDRKSSAVVNLVQGQKTDAIKRLGTTATPSVFVFGQKYEMKTYQDLETKIQELINLAESKS